MIANNPELAAAVVGTVANLIYVLSSIFAPYLPATSKSILEQLDAPFARIPSLQDIKDGWKPVAIKPGHKIGKARYLFSRIDPKKADEWREMFGGSQLERQKKEDAAKAAARKSANKASKAKKKEKKPKLRKKLSKIQQSAVRRP